MLGFLIVLLSSIFFCFQNVIVRVLFTEHTVFGVLQTGGFVTPTLQNSFLLMFMRMLLVVPLMGALATSLHAATWQDVAKLRQTSQRPLLLRSLGCGCLMFLYLALLYVSIGLIPAGIAMTLFFTYPVFTALLSWRMFGDRLSLYGWGIMGGVFIGSALTLPQSNAAFGSNHWIGVVAGLASGVTYAFYTVFAQRSFETFHPVPFTWLSFATTLVLSGFCLLVWQVHSGNLPWAALWVGALLSAIATSTGHLLNNFGIRMIGATTASMIGATNPALTVVLAWVTIQETLNFLQILGVILVTLSVAMLSRERRKKPA